ncbi:MAG: hypothetical protein JWP81_3373 [Ferruginibacter sp.]|nr:hypothetical protein [Ferruginibacter sp.]
MLKYIIAFIILVHGLIHFIGFAKAFAYGNITTIAKDISKTTGFCWLVAGFLLIAVAILYLLQTVAWPIIAIAAAVISQVLIITVWKDGRFGTIVNVILLLVAIPAFAENNFNKLVKKERNALLSQKVSGNTIITKEMLANLPEPVQRWLASSGVLGKEKIHFVRLQQKGQMRTKPGGSWLPFTATQYYNVDKASFNWQTTVQMLPFITLNGRDKLENGKGEMLIKVLSLVNVVNMGDDKKIDEAAMLRYLAEICWFPSAALEAYIQWDAVDWLTAKATMHYGGISVSGIFHFDQNGDMIGFTADRWYANGKQSIPAKWEIKTKKYQSFSGIRIPAGSEVSWELKSGDFTWLTLEIVALEFNERELYK